MIKPMENLRKLLSKLGIAAARKRGNFTVKIAGQAIAVYEGSFTITQDIKPINVLGKLDVEE